MDDRKNSGWVFLLIKNPVALIAILVVFVIAIVLVSVLGLALVGDHSSNQADSSLFPVACQQGDMNMEVWESQFQNAGAFTGKSDTFLQVAQKNQIDPVLLASIAFHETGRGSSKMVRERNNPGGLYNSSAGTFFVYPSLDEGIDAMASNLYRLYISQGLFTIEQIGAKYAPIGVANDPNNLNIHWVPNVSNMIASFGGLTANCTMVGFDSGFASPLANMKINSKYGMRFHPVDAVYKLHAGIDFACTVGTPIMAVSSGTVERSTFHSGWGNYVKISHGDKSTLYAHMTNRYVSLGDTVAQGQTIGTCGGTGKVSGPHLHFELYVGRSTIDPLPYFQNSGQGE